MEKTKKLTKKDYFLQLRELAITNEELVKFIDHELELLSNKTVSKATQKTRSENETFKDTIIEVLTMLHKPMTITEIQAQDSTLEPLSNQKMSALLIQLCKEERVTRTVDRKKVLFVINLK